MRCAVAATLPSGFRETLVASGLTNPTAMAFAPDGRLFVSEQTGRLRVIKNGTLLPAPFVSLTVDAGGERGLLGIAFDPDFAVNQYVYTYYTTPSPTPHNRISRFTANGDSAAPGSEAVIFELDNLNLSTNHNGGALAFGFDGKLYVGVGENAVPSNAQSLTNVLGKILRINKDGMIPSDNPFYATAIGRNRAIWALGLRNPFTFAFNPGGSELFINDVGQDMWEEINNGLAGANYGWPDTEGATSDPRFQGPISTYNHSNGCAITGGTFYAPATPRFPSAYVGNYFFADYCAGWIRVLDRVSGHVSPFATAISLPVDLKTGDDGLLYYLARGSGAVYRIDFEAPPTVTADSVTPNAGSGASQAFAFQFSDTAGAMDLQQGWVWINASFASTLANTCLANYTRATNAVSLMNDAGTMWMTATLGSGATLQNSQCSIALGSGTTAVLSGNTLTLTLGLTFTSTFNGAKNVYTYSQNASGINSGWQMRGTWTVAGAAPAPATVTADSVTPNAGSGSSQSFAFQFSDTAGAMDLHQAWVWINASFASTLANSCLAYYTRATNTVYLIDDAGAMWMTATLGSSGTLQNSQCAVALASSTTALSGNTLTLTLAVTFKPAFNGAKNIYTYAENGSGINSGWQLRGTWTVAPPPAPVTVTADSVAPNAGSGSSQSFAFQFSDTAGAMDLQQAWVWINASFASTLANTCLAYYTRATNTVALIDDAGTMWMTAMLGSGGTLQNSQCAIAVGSSTTVLSGNALTLTLALTFKAAFNGAKNVYMYAQNGTGGNSGWQMRGTWTVAAGAPPAPVTVTADSVTPNAGSGSSQSFAFQFSDTAGAMDLQQGWIWINASFASTLANTCLAYYTRATNTVSLIDDAGTMWMTATLGSGGTLQNSQCAIALGSSTTVLSGNALTLTLALTFKPAFSGAKNIFTYAQNGSGINSGWQTRGTWTVP
jgi:glucose/arabinose dehydrogenase